MFVISDIYYTLVINILALGLTTGEATETPGITLITVLVPATSVFIPEPEGINSVASDIIS